MNHFYVYLYRDPSRNNEPIYVGKGMGYRATNHVRRTDMHPFVQRLQYMKKNGVIPDISFICKDVDEEFALLVEVEAIAKYGRKDLGKGPLLNLSDGGEGPSNPGPETRRKIGDASRGKSWSPEFRETMLQARKENGWHERITEGARQQMKRQWEDPEYRAKIGSILGKLRSKRCTVDGITIYESKVALVRALGKGKSGFNSPTFRYIDAD